MAAHAELLRIEYTDTNGEAVADAPGTRYINPVGDITFALSAGLDRKVRVELRDKSGAVLDSAESGLIGAADRITVDGADYYGARLSIAAPAEGAYMLATQILAADGAVVEEKVESIEVDVTPPSTGKMVWSGSYHRLVYGDGSVAHYPAGAGELILDGGFKLVASKTEAMFLGVNGVTDSGSGIDKAVFQSFYADGENAGKQYASVEASYDKSAARVQVGTGGNYSVNAAHFPNDRRRMRYRFVIEDRAGNRAIREDDLYWFGAENADAAPEPVAVHNPGSTNNFLGQTVFSGFDPYIPGMPIYENPVSIVYRVPKGKHVKYDPYFGMYFPFCELGNCDAPDYEDANYIYKRVKNSYVNGTLIFPDIAWRTDYTWVSGPYAANLTYGNASVIPPNGTNYEYYRPGFGWRSLVSNGDREIGTTEPAEVITQVRVTADPRPYEQELVFTPWVGCIIPTGQTQCTVNVNAPYPPGNSVGIYYYRPRLRKAGTGLIGNEIAVLAWKWDTKTPSIIGHSHDQTRREITYTVFEPDSGANWNTVRFGWAKLRFVDASGNATEIPPNRTVTTGNETVVTFDYGAVAEGDYQVIAIASDNYRNVVTQKLVDNLQIDTRGPNVVISAINGTLPTISSLGDLRVTVNDARDDNPIITEITLSGGPASDNINLAWTSQGEGLFALEYPVMFPSLKPGDYTLTVKAEDWQGNTATGQVSLTFQPPEVAMADGMDGVVTIPGSTHAFHYGNGANVITTEPLRLTDGSTLAGTYDVYATLRSDSEVALRVNGVDIKPGETRAIMGQHNFGGSGGRLSIPLSAAEDGAAGQAHLLVSTAAPNAPVLVLPVTVWNAEATLTADAWEIRQVIDDFSVAANPAPGTACRLVGTDEEAREADPIRDPACLIEWTAIPDESVVSEDGLTVLGQALQLGEQEVAYALYLYDGDTRVQVGGGSRSVKVVTARNAVTYAPDGDYSEVYHKVEPLELRMMQQIGPECRLTLDAEAAMEEARQTSNEGRVCLLEWTHLPDGMAQTSWQSQPRLTGRLLASGANTLSWRVSIFSRSGTRVTLSETDYVMNAVAPPAPEIELDDQHRIEDGLYVAPMSGGYLGDATVSAFNAPLNVEITRAGELIQQVQSPERWGDRNMVSRRLVADARALWERIPYRISAAYTDLPEVNTVQEFDVVAVPADTVAPQVSAPQTEVLDTDDMVIDTQIADPYADGGYDPATMGRWRTRIVRYDGLDLVPLTDFVDAGDDGGVRFSIGIKDMDSDSIRIGAESALISPIEGYERTALSPRPVYITILRGGIIESNLVSRRLSGLAPLTTIVQLELAERLDYAALGDVTWQYRDAESAGEWVEFENTGGSPDRLTMTFKKGRYQVRAIVKNKNSGALYQTDMLEINAYELPDIAVTGPENAFIGSTVRYSAVTETPPAEPLVYEWSTDGGKTWVSGGPSLEISRNEEESVRISVRARFESAPGEDTQAWDEARTSVKFHQVRPPRVRITGPSLMETGVSDQFEVDVQPPYQGMDITIGGQWELPDGQVINADTLQYAATEADLAAGRIELRYRAWIDGYREQGGEGTDSHTVRIWQYEWPDFAFSTQALSSYAPTDLTIRLRSTGMTRLQDLEDPVIIWDIPEGLQVVDESRSDARGLHVLEPGSYTVQAHISDARGHSAVVSHTMEFKDSPPYEVSLEYAGSNPYDRAPLEVRLRTYISGGHPRDRIKTMTYSLDGEALTLETSYAKATLDEGEHLFKLTVTSEMGKTATAELPVTVHPNQPPTCKMSKRESPGLLRVYAECNDPDGRVISWNWTVDGEPAGITGSRLTLRTDENRKPVVTLVGFDDAGAQSEPVTLQ